MLSRISVCAIVLAAALVAPRGAQAVTIPGLVDTGVNGFVADPNYAYSGAGVGPALGAPKQAGSWVDAPAGSNWIIPTTPSVGVHDYTLSFDLTGLITTTASITGDWATDNTGEIFLNGVSTGITKGFSGFTTLNAFTISSGFQSGVNTLLFRVEDFGLPTGLLVANLGGDAQVVPEPGTLALVLLGLGMLRGFARPRR